jgi:hypothetical protein
MVADAGNADTFHNWFALPTTWLLLADHFLLWEEPLLAKEAFKQFELKTEQKRENNQNLSELMGIDACLKISRTYARFQNFKVAIKYAELAFELNHFHAETRNVLSQYSTAYEKFLANENRVFKRAQELWLQRAFTMKYIKKMKTKTLLELETKFDADPYNLETRDYLSYYARDKYRARFLFEEVCAQRIQKVFRTKRFIAMWLRALVFRYRSDASHAVARFNRTPYCVGVRGDILRITAHRRCPQKHMIHKILITLKNQELAANVIRRTYGVHLLRSVLKKRIKNKQILRDAL